MNSNLISTHVCHLYDLSNMPITCRSLREDVRSTIQRIFNNCQVICVLNKQQRAADPLFDSIGASSTATSTGPASAAKLPTVTSSFSSEFSSGSSLFVCSHLQYFPSLQSKGQLLIANLYYLYRAVHSVTSSHRLVRSRALPPPALFNHLRHQRLMLEVVTPFWFFSGYTN